MRIPISIPVVHVAMLKALARAVKFKRFYLPGFFRSPNGMWLWSLLGMCR